jgi:hypothetical protein
MKPILRRLNLYGGLLCLALVGGCSHLAKLDMAVGPAKSTAFADLLAFQARLARSNPSELTKQYNALNAAPEQSRSEADSLKLALLLSQPGFSLRNDGAALKLLQERERRLVPDSELAPFIRWYRASLQERVKLAAGADEASAQLGEEKKRADVCNDKLQALRQMEESLIERNKH